MNFVEKDGLYLNIHARKSKKLLDIVKRKKAIYQANSNTYIIPYEKGCWKDFEELGYFIPEYLKEETTRHKYMLKKLDEITLPKNITNRLYPYQVEGIKMLEAGWSFLGDMQGLGKTPQSSRFLELHEEYKTNIVMCPGFLKEKWENELSIWTTKKTKILYGRKVEKLESGYTYIINYDILSYKLPSFKSLDIDCIIADEVHYCKSNQTKRTQAMNKLVKKCKRFIPMTGTPILNNPNEIYNVLNLLAPTQFYSKAVFEARYCKMEFKFGRNQFIDSKNEDELYRILKESILIRRDYDEVKHQFAGDYNVRINSTIVPLELDSYEEYISANRDLYSYIVKTDGVKKANRISEALGLHRPRILKEIIYKNKKEKIFKWVDEHLKHNQKICLFFMRTEHLNEFVERYGRNALKINGETKTENRFEMCNMFNQSRRLNVLCGNIKACGVGLDLIGSHDIAFVDFDWNFSNMEQVIKRADRFGQKEPVVNVYYFAGKNTIEDSYLMKKLDNKNNIAKQIIDGRELKSKERFKNSFK